MNNPFGIPGVNGSLGKCAYCGKPFLAEIVLEKPVRCFTIACIQNTLCAHDECLSKYSELTNWRDLPEGPIRQAIESGQKENVEL